MLSALIPENGPPDVRGIRRFALTQAATARRERRADHARMWDRIARKALRALRFAARLEAGTPRRDPSCSHSLFSGAEEEALETTVPALAPDPDRRQAFREGRRRR